MSKELTRNQKDHKYCQELSKCKSCQYADQAAIKEYRSCCTYGSGLKFGINGVCITHKEKV